MLTCLRLSNLAIIDEIEVEFGPGLNVVTGETGAGESILITALQRVMGGNSRPELVRTGADEAVIEALFELGVDPQLRARIEAAELEAAELAAGDGLVSRRVVWSEERSGT